MSYRYKTVKRGGKTVLLHRWLMEQHLGRTLGSDEQVHHLNHDAHDNRIENLALVTGATHQSIHHPPVMPTEKTCAVCRASFRPHKTKRRRQQTCSWPCRNALIAHRRHGTPLPDVVRALVEVNAPELRRDEVAA